MRFGITLLSEKLKWAPFSAGDEMGTGKYWIQRKVICTLAFKHVAIETKPILYIFISFELEENLWPLRPSYVYPYHTPWKNETWLAESTIFVCYISPRVKTLRLSPPTFSVAGADLAFQGQARTQCSSVCGGASGHGTLERRWLM